jgi:Flp pilus assembly protein TadD
VALAAVCAAGAACARPVAENAGNSPDPVPIEQLSAMMDSAATAFRDGDIFQAREVFQRVIAADSTLAAAWFGLFITQRALGDTAAANAAFQTSRRLAEPTSTAAVR